MIRYGYMAIREQTLKFWLQHECGFEHYDWFCLAGDASFRSYFRVINKKQSYVVMDAPPEQENCLPFVAISHALRAMGIKTPEVFKSNFVEGFLLLTDFGDRVLLKQLNPENAGILYKKALDVLSVMQGCKEVRGWTIPTFTRQIMRQELEGFKEWFLMRYLQISEQDSRLLNSFFDWLAEIISEQPYVFTHRDYHSANLMLLANDEIGVLDFQDAFSGPVTYDLVSLLRDCYISWPDEFVNDLALSFFRRLQKNNNLKISDDQFLFWFDSMGIQRHLKALMTFSRKSIRDGNDNYLSHIPRTLDYLLRMSERYPESKVLNKFLLERVPCVQ
jgi:N-acetylmuramate 1-kinase